MRRNWTDRKAARKQYPSGQSVPFDGVYVDSWGGRLPLLQGERLPMHRIMGASKWIYDGHLSSGLPKPVPMHKPASSPKAGVRHITM